jgi:polyhydroxybutyrate depolymerase
VVASCLALVTTVWADTVATGTFTQVNTGPVPSSTGTLVFPDVTNDVFGTPVNFGDPGHPTYVGPVGFSGTFALGSESGFDGTTLGSASSTTAGLLSYDYAGVFVCDFSTSAYSCAEVGDLTNVTGSALASLPSNLVYTFASASTGIGGDPNNRTGTFAINAFLPAATPAGSAVPVTLATEVTNPVSGTTVALSVAVTFDTVTTGGETLVTNAPYTPAALGGDFSVENLPAGFFDLSTSAAVSGPIRICVDYADTDDDLLVDGTTVAVADLRLLHDAGDGFADVTVAPFPPNAAKQVCGEVSSLSPFVVAELVGGSPTTTVPTSTTTTTLPGTVPIAGLKLIVVDKTAVAGKAKAVFVAKDPGVTKGPGTNPAQIEATLAVAYDGASGTFGMPQGADWLVNSASVGKYVNKTAPTGGAVKVSVIKQASLVKVVAKSLGDAPLDISSAPVGPVYVMDTIVNGGHTTHLCTKFTGCVHKVIAGGTGYKLVCKGSGTGDPTCGALPTSTTSTSIVTTTTMTTTSTSLPPLTPGLTTGITISFESLTRTYDVYVPSSYDGVTPLPLVLDFHGYSVDTALQRAFSGLQAVAEAEGFVAAWPQGYGTTGTWSWNAGPCCDPALAAGLDDVGLAKTVAWDVAGRGAVDRRRIYAVGHSNGSLMAQRLGCDAAPVFAAVAGVAAPIVTTSPPTTCAPARPIPVLHVAGIDDTVVPYAGGASGPFPSVVVGSAADNLAFWRGVGACPSSTPDVFEPFLTGGSCSTFTTCAPGVQIAQCSLHATDSLKHFAGAGYPNDEGIQIGTRLWDFVSQFTLPVACGDGIIDVGETCDDGGDQAGDGCGATCLVEAGWSCGGVPSSCSP